MKKLVMISMVQYFLYERTDLEIGHNTAFLGPNGTGKTALLDAFQIVILAADGNRTHYNASGEGKRRARTLRDYCLGVYGQTDDKRYRNAANTYINLVFRDQKTNYPVTIGASFSADETSPEATLNGLYVLPGVALTSKMHVEVQDGRKSPSRGAGSSTSSPTSAGPSGRRRRSPRIARPSCGTCLWATWHRPASAPTRIHPDLVCPVAEAQPGRRRPQRGATRQPGRGAHHRRRPVQGPPSSVPRSARAGTRRPGADRARQRDRRQVQLVLRERTAATNVQALEAVYETERVAENLSATQDKVDELTGELSAKQDALKEAELAVELHEAARDRALQARDRDPDYAKQASTAAHLSDLERSHGEKASELSAWWPLRRPRWPKPDACRISAMPKRFLKPRWRNSSRCRSTMSTPRFRPSS